MILDMCKPPEDVAKAVDAKVNEFAGKGFRTLGVAAANGTDDVAISGAAAAV